MNYALSISCAREQNKRAVRRRFLPLEKHRGGRQSILTLRQANLKRGALVVYHFCRVETIQMKMQASVSPVGLAHITSIFNAPIMFS